jgi:hypothetical protein
MRDAGSGSAWVTQRGERRTDLAPLPEFQPRRAAKVKTMNSFASAQ